MVLGKEVTTTSEPILRPPPFAFPALQQRIISALGRKGAIEVLVVLFADSERERTARQIAGEAQVPTMSCSRILREFHDLRIVRRRRIGRAFAISLDRGSLATRFLERLARLTRYE